MIIKGMQKAMDREGIEYDPLMGIAGWEQLKDNPFKKAKVSSDAFTPFRDSYKRLGRVGVSAVAQPFGSKNDGETIEEANENDMATVATLERGFGHW
jgi:phosphoribosylaminoimidazolecarboxamide formyltransferase/IMP cyclohydrolase